MIATALTVIASLALIAFSTYLIVKAFRQFSRREEAFTKITIPPLPQPYPELPKMVGLSKTIEETAAAEAAERLAADIEFDLYRGADVVNGLPTPPPPPAKPKRKRAPKGMRKTDIPGLYVAKESSSIFAPKRKQSKRSTRRTKAKK
jgi:hypothetical protein